MISVMIADDHPLVRDAWRLLLERTGDIQVVAMAENGQEAIEQATLYCPDVTVMDVSMPIMDGIEATKQIFGHCPETRVLMVSMHPSPEYIKRSLEAGASGYVLKELADGDLVRAIYSLHMGKRYFSEAIAEIAEYYL